MYPRNNATPPRIAIGAVVQIADGAVQSSGVSVVVRPEGGAESAGGGTIAYSAASGVVYYTPTQAETDYTAFCVIAYKTACIPAQVTVVTTASSTAGVAVLNTATQGQIDAMTRGLIAGVVGSSSSTTVVNVTSTESGLAVSDQLKGRVIIFNKDTTTAALRGQGAPIDTNDTTSITVASGDAFTTAPASGDTFTIY